MGTKPTSMHQIKQIIELHFKGKSKREIGRLTGKSRNTVREYIRKIIAVGITKESLQQHTDETLGAIFYSEEMPLHHRSERYKIVQNEIATYVEELRKVGVTRQLLWEEYRSEHSGGYGYSQFCEHLSGHLKRHDAVMHFTHKPGEQMQVDYAGDLLSYVDKSTGEIINCQVLVCVLPYSNYTFVIAMHTQKQEEFINGICYSLAYIGGVPQSIKSDNLRSAVTKSNRYEPHFTEAMEYLAAHYNTSILAARVRKPRDKASVEKAVDLTYKRIYAPLRHQTFYSLAELNIAMRKQLEEHNNRLFKGKNYSRKNLFEQEEKQHLGELPSTPYQIKHTTLGKVQRNYHVIVGEDYHQYSVPYTLIGKRLKIVYTLDDVEVYDGQTRVALHRRSCKKNGYTTQKQHMPINHQCYADAKGWNAEDFELEARSIGTSTLAVVKTILAAKFFYEQTYNSCLGILRLAKKYTNERLEAACTRALASPIINYKTIENILKNNLDKQTNHFSEPTTTIPVHYQVRGPQSYQ